MEAATHRMAGRKGAVGNPVRRTVQSRRLIKETGSHTEMLTGPPTGAWIDRLDHSISTWFWNRLLRSAPRNAKRERILRTDRPIGERGRILRTHNRRPYDRNPNTHLHIERHGTMHRSTRSMDFRIHFASGNSPLNLPTTEPD